MNSTEPARAESKRSYRRYGRARAEAQGWKCFYCGDPLNLDTLTADHVVAVSKGGKDAYRNIQPACARCNSNKSDKPLIVFMDTMGQRHSKRRRRPERFPRMQVFNPIAQEWIPIGSANVKHLTKALVESGRYMFR